MRSQNLSVKIVHTSVFPLKQGQGNVSLTFSYESQDWNLAKASESRIFGIVSCIRWSQRLLQVISL